MELEQPDRRQNSFIVVMDENLVGASDEEGYHMMFPRSNSGGGDDNPNMDILTSEESMNRE